MLEKTLSIITPNTEQTDDKGNVTKKDDQNDNFQNLLLMYEN